MENWIRASLKSPVTGIHGSGTQHAPSTIIVPRGRTQIGCHRDHPRTTNRFEHHVGRSAQRGVRLRGEIRAGSEKRRGADVQREFTAPGRSAATAIGPAPRRRAQNVAARAIGPAPITSTRARGARPARTVPWSPTASGSINAPYETPSASFRHSCWPATAYCANASPPVRIFAHHKGWPVRHSAHVPHPVTGSAPPDRQS